MAPLRTALVLGLLVASGCSAVGTDPQSTPVTPAPVPSPDPWSADRGAVVDADRIVAAHRNTLTATNYTITTTWDVRGTGSDTHRYLYERTRTRVAVNATQYGGQYRLASTRHPRYGNHTQDIAFWTNGSLVAHRYLDDGDTSAYEQGEGERLLRDIPKAWEIRLALEDATVSATVADSGATVVTATDIGVYYKLRRGLGITGITDPRARLVVAPSGVVRSFVVTYRAKLESPYGEAPGREVRVTRRVTVSEVGNTTVRKPEWADAATGNATIG